MTPNIAVPTTHISATEFIASLKGKTREEREILALQRFQEGHVPSWMRTFSDISFTFKEANGTQHQLQLGVTPDYLSIGTDDDRMRMPLAVKSAQGVADSYGCMLPTRKIVDLIWRSSVGKLAPQPWGPPYDASMMSTDRYVVHNQRIDALAAKTGVDTKILHAGHKKDVVITNRLVVQPKQVAIYGWHMTNGKAIQPLSCVHESSYADYAHGVRLVSMMCVLDGVVEDLSRVLSDKTLCIAVSDEGPLRTFRYPGT